MRRRQFLLALAAAPLAFASSADAAETIIVYKDAT